MTRHTLHIGHVTSTISGGGYDRDSRRDDDRRDYRCDDERELNSSSVTHLHYRRDDRDRDRDRDRRPPPPSSHNYDRHDR
jgi:hypothetical protein